MKMKTKILVFFLFTMISAADILMAQITMGSGCAGNPDYTILQSSGSLQDSGGGGYTGGAYTNNQLYRYTICNPDGQCR